MKLDSLRTVGTPEGATLELRLAGPLVRILAWSIDVAVRGIAYAVGGSVLAWAGQAGSGLFLILLFLGEWFYPVWFETRHDGATPGKRVYGLAVVHTDGTSVGWRASLVRNLLRFADFLPFGYLSGLVSMAVSPDFQRLGDLIAGTVVIHRDVVKHPALAGGVVAAAPPVVLTLEEQRSLIDYVERSASWSRERRREVAVLAAPLLKTEERPVTQLRSIAAWLLGQR